MCNTNAISVALLAAEAAVIASLVFLFIAIPLSGFVFIASSSIAPMIAAGVSLAVAIVALGVAITLVEGCTGGNCGMAAAGVRLALIALVNILLLQAIGIGIGIAGGAVPFVAAIAGTVVVVCLLAQGPFWAILGGQNEALARCQAATNPTSSTALATVVFVVAIVVMIAVFTAAIFFAAAVPPLPLGG